MHILPEKNKKSEPQISEFLLPFLKAPFNAAMSGLTKKRALVPQSIRCGSQGA
jgi:hypothetical protein